MGKKLEIFNAITNITILVLLICGSFIWADANGIWHRAEDVQNGTFGTDEGGGNYVFANNLTIEEKLCLGGKCQGSWDEIAKANQVCEDAKAVVGFTNNGTIICDWPNARYR